jgi:hypothetical protein
MGAARRLCVKAVVLAATTSAISSLALPGCQFPEYGLASAHGGSAGTPDGGTANAIGGAPDDGGQGGSDVGGDSGAGDGGEAGEQPVPPSCAVQACVAGPPAGWLGPIAYWESKSDEQGSPPKCPKGYADPIDLHRELVAPASTCACTCGAAQGQVCEATLHIYSDMGCANECATVAVQACSAVSGCTGSQGSQRNDPPTLSGGSCEASVNEPVAASWQYNARLCQPSGACEDSDQVCAPTPTSPYATQLCVMSVTPEGQAPPACPTGFPNARKDLYESYTDSRGCSECTCGPVSGGSCSGRIALSIGGDCSVSDADYQLGSGCKTFNLGAGNIHPARAGGHYTVSPGACSVAKPAQPTGSAEASGSITKVCCQ